jgi:hypothetical protein
MPEEKTKVIEKYYIEVSASHRKKFFSGLLNGLGYGIGLTLGTSIFFLFLGILVSRIDLQPILGKFLAGVISAAQPHLNIK